MQMDSIPEFVMRTGVYSPVAPANARQDIAPNHIARVTRGPVGLPYTTPTEVQMMGFGGGVDPEDLYLMGYEGEMGLTLKLPASPEAKGLAGWGLVGGTVIGSVVGALYPSSTRLRGAGKGALAGLLLGGLVAAVAARAAALTAAQVRTFIPAAK